MSSSRTRRQPRRPAYKILPCPACGEKLAKLTVPGSQAYTGPVRFETDNGASAVREDPTSSTTGVRIEARDNRGDHIDMFRDDIVGAYTRCRCQPGKITAWRANELREFVLTGQTPHPFRP